MRIVKYSNANVHMFILKKLFFFLKPVKRLQFHVKEGIPPIGIHIFLPFFKPLALIDLSESFTCYFYLFFLITYETKYLHVTFIRHFVATKYYDLSQVDMR